MRLMIALALILTYIPAEAGNLVVNGDFAQELDIGWEYVRIGGGTKTAERRAWTPPDSGFYAFVRQYGTGGSAKLTQLIEVPGPDLDFSFDASWAISGGTSTCWPVAVVSLDYYEDPGGWKGETRWYRHNAYCTWRPSDRLNLISITDPDWKQYSLNVREEIENNVRSVNPDLVRTIGLSVFSFTSSG